MILNESDYQLLFQMLTPQYGYDEEGIWMVFAPDKPYGDWKIHVYSDTAEDWAHVAAVVLPYAQKHRLGHKTVKNLNALTQLNNNAMQLGKAFTLYTKTTAALKTVIQDLDLLLVKMNICRPDQPAIYGDKAIGKSHRVFYRYDKDIHGNYRLNDGCYCPPGIEDPFLSLTLD